MRRLNATLAVMCALGAVQIAIFEEGDARAVILPILVATAAAFGTAYALAAKARARAAALLTVAIQIVVPTLIAIGVAGVRVDAMSCAAWSSLALLSALTTLGPRSVLVVGVALVVESVLANAWLGLSARAICESALFLVATTSAVCAYATHRDRLERERQGHLRERNAELEDLRGSLEHRVLERTAELTTAYRTLRSRHELLVRTQKMAAVGQLSAGLAHELASPLAALLASVEELGELSRDYERAIGDLDTTADRHRGIALAMAEMLDVAKRAGERALAVIRGIRGHARDGSACAVERFDAVEVSASAIALLAHHARAANVQVSIEGSPGTVVLDGVPSRWSQVVTNLVHNAIDAIAEAGRPGRVVVRAERGADGATIRVIDDGPGIPEHVGPRIFEPLFTTKPYGKGTGLGLSIAGDIVRDELGGSISVETARATGTTFVIRLPHRSAPAAAG